MIAKEKIPQTWRDHDRSFRAYRWSHRTIGIGRTLVGLFLVTFCLMDHRFAQIEGLVAAKVSRPFLLWLSYFGVLALLWEILSFPFSIAHHWVERHYHLSKQTTLSWLWDKIKGLILGSIIGMIALGILYLSIQALPEYWWVLACSLFVLLSIILAQLAPVLLIPLFFKLKPMEPGVLKDRLFKLCERFKVVVTEIYHLGLGEKTEKGNAAFVGLGKTKRIIIGDTLYEKFSQDEVEAVFAHELGHQVHNDLWKGIIFSSLLMFTTFFMANRISKDIIFPQIDADLNRPFGLLAFFIVLSVIQIATGFLSALFSRQRERLADRFAMEKTGSGEMLANALERLTIQNRGQFLPNAIVEFFTYSHPAPWRRITKLRVN